MLGLLDHTWPVGEERGIHIHLALHIFEHNLHLKALTESYAEDTLGKTFLEIPSLFDSMHSLHLDLKKKKITHRIFITELQ